MPIIGSNPTATAASSSLTRNQELLTKSFRKLSSGSRLSDPSDDAAGVAVSANLTALIERLSASGEGSANVVSFAQTADGFMSTIQQQMTRMGELAQRATDSTLNAADRQNYNIEFQALKQQIDTISSNASFNGVPIFANGSVTTGTNGSGVTDSFATSTLGTAASLGLTPLDISTVSGATSTISGLTQSISALSSRRAEVGAEISKFNFHIQNNATENLNVMAANSRISDLNIAEESTNLANLNILNQAGVAMLSQANVSQRSVLALLS